MKPLPGNQLNIPTVPLQRESSSRSETAEDTVTQMDSEPEVAVAEPECPRCGGQLINPGSLGWCRSCGYCSSLEEERAKAVLPAAGTSKSSFLGAVELLQLLSKLPRWVWVLLGGVVAVVLVSVAVDWMLNPEEYEFERALWSSVQLGSGWLLLLVAQGWVLFQLAPNDDKLGPRDFFVPFRLWNLAMRRLPETRYPVWVGVWSMTAMLCALLIIGGYEYWYQFYKPKKYANKGLLGAIQNLAEAKDNKSLTDAVKDFAATQDLKKQDKDKEKKATGDRRPTLQCVVVGYVPATDSVPFTLLVATLREDKLTFAGPVRQGIGERSLKELENRLPQLEQQEPVLRGLKFLNAIWVKPELFCEVHQDGFDRDGHFLKPALKGLLRN